MGYAVTTRPERHGLTGMATGTVTRTQIHTDTDSDRLTRSRPTHSSAARQTHRAEAIWLAITRPSDNSNGVMSEEVNKSTNRIRMHHLYAYIRQTLPSRRRNFVTTHLPGLET